jgi:hypothetical protein
MSDEILSPEEWQHELNRIGYPAPTWRLRAHDQAQRELVAVLTEERDQLREEAAAQERRWTVSHERERIAAYRHRTHEAEARVAVLTEERNQEEEWRTDLGNAVVENAPEWFDGEESLDFIAVKYVRWLETRVAELVAGLREAEETELDEDQELEEPEEP